MKKIAVVLFILAATVTAGSATQAAVIGGPQHMTAPEKAYFQLIPNITDYPVRENPVVDGTVLNGLCITNIIEVTIEGQRVYATTFAVKNVTADLACSGENNINTRYMLVDAVRLANGALRYGEGPCGSEASCIDLGKARLVERNGQYLLERVDLDPEIQNRVGIETANQKLDALNASYSAQANAATSEEETRRQAELLRQQMDNYNACAQGVREENQTRQQHADSENQVRSQEAYQKEYQCRELSDKVSRASTGSDGGDSKDQLEGILVFVGGNELACKKQGEYERVEPQLDKVADVCGMPPQ